MSTAVRTQKSCSQYVHDQMKQTMTYHCGSRTVRLRLHNILLHYSHQARRNNQKEKSGKTNAVSQNYIGTYLGGYF